MATKGQVERPGRPGRRPSLNADHRAALRAITQEQPRSSLDEVTRELFRRAGVKVSTVTVRKALREAGIERLKPLRRAGERAAVQGATPARYGYTAAHRRRDGASGMNTDLTDAEWALVAYLFEREGRCGAPARYGRRETLNACCYALRTGCAWRLLPKTSRRGRRCTNPSAAGLRPACSRRCTIDGDNSGAPAWAKRLNRPPRSSTRKAPAAPPRAATPGSTPVRRSRGASAIGWSTPRGLLLAVTITAASVQDRDAAGPVVAQACAKVPD